jgi:hypothetical protein
MCLGCLWFAHRQGRAGRAQVQYKGVPGTHHSIHFGLEIFQIDIAQGHVQSAPDPTGPEALRSGPLGNPLPWDSSRKSYRMLCVWGAFGLDFGPAGPAGPKCKPQRLQALPPQSPKRAPPQIAHRVLVD